MIFNYGLFYLHSLARQARDKERERWAAMSSNPTPHRSWVQDYWSARQPSRLTRSYWVATDYGRPGGDFTSTTVCWCGVDGLYMLDSSIGRASYHPHKVSGKHADYVIIDDPHTHPETTKMPEENSQYNSTTHGLIKLSFDARRLMQNLRYAIQAAIQRGTWTDPRQEVSHARGELAQYISKLEAKAEAKAEAESETAWRTTLQQVREALDCRIGDVVARAKHVARAADSHRIAYEETAKQRNEAQQTVERLRRELEGARADQTSLIEQLDCACKGQERAEQAAVKLREQNDFIAKDRDDGRTAWRSITDTLDRVRPNWLRGPGSARDCAVAAIGELMNYSERMNYSPAPNVLGAVPAPSYPLTVNQMHALRDYIMARSSSSNDPMLISKTYLAAFKALTGLD